MAQVGAAAARPPARPQADGEWPMAARDHASTRFSPLDLITAENAHELVQAWTFDTGLERGHEAAPIVVGETMYLVTPYPNVVYALDVGKKGAVRWKFEPETSPAAQGVACCDVVNRGGAFADGRFYFNTLDGQTIALDARSGAQLWKTRVGNIHIGETLTMGRSS
jgi:lanthanide-dependent methanol dehydrogenase